MDFSSEGLVMGGHLVHLQEESGLARDQRLVTIDMLPDDVLVGIFDFYEYVDDLDWMTRQNTWHALVHVCRRWRNLVFASPRRLNLRLVYHGHRPMSEALDAWPVLPVSLTTAFNPSKKSRDNILGALESEHSNRICEISIFIMIGFHWERFMAAMQKPFPELTRLRVWVDDVSRVLPESFLGGSAPRLRTLWLEGISFPSIPKLLLSANGLVKLSLWDVPDSGYFSPEKMATALAVMTSLEHLHLEFRSPRSRPDPESRSLSPPKRFVLALTQLIFKGVYEYSEDLLARIDAPLLYNLYIEFFMDLDFHIPQLSRFINHAEEFKTFDRADVWTFDDSISLNIYPNAVEVDDCRSLDLEIDCRGLANQLLSLCQVCSTSFPCISALEELQIWEGESLSSSHWKDDMENSQWLELLDQFTALKDLYLTDGIAQHFCGALQELSGERTTEVLPALRNIFVRGPSLEPVQEAIKSFVTARRLSGHPVAVDHWKD